MRMTNAVTAQVDALERARASHPSSPPSTNATEGGASGNDTLHPDFSSLETTSGGGETAERDGSALDVVAGHRVGRDALAAEHRETRRANKELKRRIRALLVEREEMEAAAAKLEERLESSSRAAQTLRDQVRRLSVQSRRSERSGAAASRDVVVDPFAALDAEGGIPVPALARGRRARGRTPRRRPSPRARRFRRRPSSRSTRPPAGRVPPPVEAEGEGGGRARRGGRRRRRRGDSRVEVQGAGALARGGGGGAAQHPGRVPRRRGVRRGAEGRGGRVRETRGRNGRGGGEQPGVQDAAPRVTRRVKKAPPRVKKAPPSTSIERPELHFMVTTYVCSNCSIPCLRNESRNFFGRRGPFFEPPRKPSSFVTRENTTPALPSFPLVASRSAKHRATDAMSDVEALAAACAGGNLDKVEALLAKGAGSVRSGTRGAIRARVRIPRGASPSFRLWARGRTFPTLRAIAISAARPAALARSP